MGGSAVSSALIDAWLLDQRIRLCSTALRALTVKTTDQAIQNSRIRLTGFVAENAASGIDRLSLPTRNLLASIGSEYFGDAGFEEFEDELKAATDENSNGRNVDASLQTHAVTLLKRQHITFEAFLKWATRISSRGKSTDNWQRSLWERMRKNLDLESVDEQLRRLRESDSLNTRISAIDQLYALDNEWTWKSLCLALMSEQFCWPLLSGRIHNDSYGTSLPIDLSLTLPNQGQGITFLCEMDRRKCAYIRGDNHIPQVERVDRFNRGALNWTGEFLQSFVTGFSVGKKLWSTQNGRADLEERENVGKNGLRVDWSFANRIVTETVYQGLAVFPDYPISGRSAEAYISQTVLARLLDAPIPAGVATGTIDRHDGALPIKWVEDIGFKAEWAHQSNTFTRLILPSEAQANLNDELKTKLEMDSDSAHMEVNYCPTARSAADAMQRSGWRRATFIRAPEERFTFYEALGRLHSHAVEHGDIQKQGTSNGPDAAPMKEERIILLKAQTKDWLIGGKVAVRWFQCNPEDCRPWALGQWLAWIDHSVRIDPDRDRTGPGLGVLCLRLGSDDNEIRIWSQLFESLDINPDLWREFQWATKSVAQKIFARILSNFRCNREVSITPPPDLLVIVDEGGLTKTPTNRIFTDDIRVQMHHILSRELGDQLDGYVRDDARSRVLGNTRILILQPNEAFSPNCNIPRPLSDNDEALAPLDAEWVDNLSVFRSGFSVQAAATIMRNHDHDQVLSLMAVLEQLNKLVQQHILGKHRGEYYIRWDHKRGRESADIPAKDHYRAALALAPILRPGNQFSAGNRDNLFDGWAVNEALWHLHECYVRTFQREQGFQRRIGEATLTLLNLMPTPYWDMVRVMAATGTKGKKDALELVSDLLAAESKFRKTDSRKVHSSRYALAINVIAQNLNSPVSDVPSLLDQADSWFSEGQQSMEGGNNEDTQTVKLFSEYAYCLKRASNKQLLGRTSSLADIEEKLDKALEKYWRNSNLQKSNLQKNIPISREYFRMRIFDENKQLLDRSKDAWIACELWGIQSIELKHQWHEPWLWLLSLMSPVDFDAAEIASVMDLMNESQNNNMAPARSVAHYLRLSAYMPRMRKLGTKAAENLVAWLTGHNRLYGPGAYIAWTFIEEWCAESHHSFDLADSLETPVLSGALREYRLRDTKRKHDPAMAKLASILYRNSWSCWALLAKLQREQNNHLSSHDRQKILQTLNQFSPKQFFEPDMEIGGKKGDAFSQKGIPERYFKARYDALRWIYAEKLRTNNPTVKKAARNLYENLSPYLR